MARRWVGRGLGLGAGCAVGALLASCGASPAKRAAPLAGAVAVTESVPTVRAAPLAGAVAVTASATLDDWIEPDLFEAPPDPPPPGHDSALVARHFRSWAYLRPSARARLLGSVRQGQPVWGRDTRISRGCSGTWFELATGGYVCAGGGFEKAEQPPNQTPELAPVLAQVLPYDYVQVKVHGAPRFDAMPPPRNRSAPFSGEGGTPGSTEGGSKEVGSGLAHPGELVELHMAGDYFLAVAGVEPQGEERFVRTLTGKYVRARDVARLPRSPMHGVRQPQLPLAFVTQPRVSAFRASESGGGAASGLTETAELARYARFTVKGVATHAGKRYAVAPDGLMVAVEALGIARRRTPPPAVQGDEKWIHVDLPSQTLVAYRGSNPVFATLTSSGKAGYETPAGTFRIQHKHVSVTMRGSDPKDGPYEVEEVPWTMFYHTNYALHGAYWHDEFGEVRSHGCTNLPPADARWLLGWTEPQLPPGFHSIKASEQQPGTLVRISP